MQASKWVNGLGTITTLFALVLASLAQDIEAKEPNVDFPISFESEFNAYRHDKKIGTAKLKLSEKQSGQYELTYSSKVSRFFLSDKRSEKTTFEYKNNQIVPLTYSFSRKGTGPNKALDVEFDSKNKLIKIEQQDDLKWNGEYDNQLFRIDISRQLFLGKKSFEYHFLNYRGQKRKYEIEVVETELLKLPYGDIEAVKVKVKRESNKRQTFAWFAPSIDFVLVRIQQFKEGEEQGDIRLSSYSRQ